MIMMLYCYYYTVTRAHDADEHDEHERRMLPRRPLSPGRPGAASMCHTAKSVDMAELGLRGTPLSRSAPGGRGGTGTAGFFCAEPRSIVVGHPRGLPIVDGLILTRLLGLPQNVLADVIPRDWRHRVSGRLWWGAGRRRQNPPPAHAPARACTGQRFLTEHTGPTAVRARAGGTTTRGPFGPHASSTP